LDFCLHRVFFSFYLLNSAFGTISSFCPHGSRGCRPGVLSSPLFFRFAVLFFCNDLASPRFRPAVLFFFPVGIVSCFFAFGCSFAIRSTTRVPCPTVGHCLYTALRICLPPKRYFPLTPLVPCFVGNHLTVSKISLGVRAAPYHRWVLLFAGVFDVFVTALPPWDRYLFPGCKSCLESLPPFRRGPHLVPTCGVFLAFFRPTTTPASPTRPVRFLLPLKYNPIILTLPPLRPQGNLCEDPTLFFLVL